MKLSLKHIQNSGYTLIETLVASSIMMIAVGAAASLSLSMVTQEEIAERTVRAANYLENAATLYSLGFDDAAAIQDILPPEPVVTNLTVSTPAVEAVAGIAGGVEVVDIQISFRPSRAEANPNSSEVEWTGGDNSAIRTQSVRVIRDTP